MRRWLSVLAVIAFVAADVVLVVLAVRHVQRDPDSSAVPILSSPSPSTTKAPGRNKPQTPVRGTTVLLALTPEGQAFRATSQECSDGEPAEFELANGGGFDDVSPQQPPTQVLAVAAPSATDLTVVGTDRECSPVMYRSDDGGLTWADSPDTEGMWHLIPANGTSVHAPQGDVDAGCTVASLSPVSESNARVLCDEGTIAGTANGGTDWVVLGRLTGAVAVSFSTTGDALGLVTEPGCPARVYTTSDGGATWAPTACLAGEPAQAISVTNGRAVAQAGGILFASSDAGATWRSRG